MFSILALVLSLLGTPAHAQGCGQQNPNCIVPTAPVGTSNGQAASTEFVQTAVPFVNYTTFSPVLDCSTDDSTAFQSAVNALPNGGILYMPDRQACSAIASTITIRAPVLIYGPGQGSFHDVGTTPSFVFKLKWTGSAAGTMIDFSPTTGASAQAIAGGGVLGIALDGNASLGGIGLNVRSVRSAQFRLHVEGWSITGMSTGVVTPLGEARNFQHNTVWITGRMLDATAGSIIQINGDASANSSNNLFDFIGGQYLNGIGVDCSGADNNVFKSIHIIRGGGGTSAAGVRLKAAATAAQTCSNNYFLHMSPGASGLVVQGTADAAAASLANRVESYDKANGAPDPSIHTNASLAWCENLNLSCVLGQGSFGAITGTSISLTGNIIGNQATFNQVTSPLVVGSSSGTTGVQLTLQSTLANGTTDAVAIKGGNNGATTFGTFNATKLDIPQTTASTSVTTGALTVAGGAGISQQLSIRNLLHSGDFSAVDAWSIQDTGASGLSWLFGPRAGTGNANLFGIFSTSLRFSVNGSTGLVNVPGDFAANDVAVTGSNVPTVGLNNSAANTLSLYTRGLVTAQLTSAASAVNFPTITASATGVATSIAATGTDGNIDLTLSSKGTGNINFQSDALGATQFQVVRTASATRNLTATGSNGGNPVLATTAGAMNLAPNNGHATFTGGTAPTLTAGCNGAGSSVSGTDASGTVTGQTAAATTCTLTFGTAFGAAPNCVAMGISSPLTGTATPATGTLVVNFASTANYKFTYFCPGV